MARSWQELAQQLEVRPMPARSLVLTTLLGAHPPRLPPQALVAVGELFAIAPGTIRTALSRMTAEGELIADDGNYALADTFAPRQRALDSARVARRQAWDGSWWSAVVLSDRRTLADRRLFRAEMARSLMGELRPDVWLRPANLGEPVSAADLLVTRGMLPTAAGRDLAASLWDLPQLAGWMRRLTDETNGAIDMLTTGNASTLAASFIVSVAVARALTTDPQLPDELVGPAWPADELRRRYDELEARHGRTLRRFLADRVMQN